jgi:hypothetical protein
MSDKGDETNWETFRLSDGRLLGDITVVEGCMIAAGATAAEAGTIYRKARACRLQLEQRDDGSWLAIAESDGMPLMCGSLSDIHHWLGDVKERALPVPAGRRVISQPVLDKKDLLAA